MQRFRTVAILGVGLIGGSIGQALRSRGLADRVVGIGRDPRRLDEAVALGAIDESTTEPGRVVSDAEVIVVCTPVTRVAADILRLAASAGPGVLITDAGSTKRAIVEAVERDDRARAAFVGAHPLAGSERTGVSAARPDLFDGRVVVLTPTPRTPADRLERAGRFWGSLGGRLLSMDPEEHDRALARTSHLPHVAAAALSLCVPPDQLPLAAGAFRDGTRVAAADAALWAGILFENRDHVLAAIDEFGERLAEFRRDLAERDEVSLRERWGRARALRLRFQDAARGRPPLGP